MILRLVRLNAAVCGLAGETTWTGPTMRGAEPVPNDPSPMRGGLAPGFPGGMGVTDWPDRCGHCGGAIAAGPGADPQGRESVSSNWLRMQSTPRCGGGAARGPGRRRARADLGVVGGHGGAGRRSHRRDGGRRTNRRTTGGNQLPLGVSPRESTVVVEVHGSLARAGLVALHQFLAELIEALATFSSGRTFQLPHSRAGLAGRLGGVGAIVARNQTVTLACAAPTHRSVRRDGG